MRQVDNWLLQQLIEFIGTTAVRIELCTYANFEAHRHQPCVAKLRSKRQRSAARDVRNGLRCRQPRPERQLRHGQDFANGRVLSCVGVQPVGAIIPSPGRRCRQIEAALGEGTTRGGRNSLGPGKKARGRVACPCSINQSGPDGRRDTIHRVAPKSCDPHIQPTENLIPPPTEMMGISHRNTGSESALRSFARIWGAVVVPIADSQARLSGDAIKHNIQHQPQIVIASEAYCAAQRG